jgi:hypothetical protein
MGVQITCRGDPCRVESFSLQTLLLSKTDLVHCKSDLVKSDSVLLVHRVFLGRITPLATLGDAKEQWC